MVINENSSVAHTLADVPVELPLDILLALPEHATVNPSVPAINLPAIVTSLLSEAIIYHYGRFTWGDIKKITDTRVWAPAWRDKQLRAFVLTGHYDRPELQTLLQQIPITSLRASSFPGLPDSAGHGGRVVHYDVVHFTGRVSASTLDLGKRRLLGRGDLSSGLQAARTRLLVLVVGFLDFNGAVELARYLVSEKGPAVLVVSPRSAQVAHDFFTSFYANIIHNFSLPHSVEMAWQTSGKSPQVHLEIGQGGAELLALDRWMNILQEKLQRAKNIISPQKRNETQRSLTEIRSRIERVLPRSQAELMAPRLTNVEKRLTRIKPTHRNRSLEVGSEMLMDARGRMQYHEREGVVPLAMVADAVTEADTDFLGLAEEVEELSRDVEEAASRAPRVLNANFAKLDSPGNLGPRQGLVAGQEYDLLVDVGPRWDHLESLVTGKDVFPIEALQQMDPTAPGYLVQVVLASQDFTPVITSADIWVPREGGRSYPMRDGQPDEKRGPVALRVRAPEWLSRRRKKPMEARGRLCLYYENNLLQSGVVRVGVVREEGHPIPQDNSINIDYVLTGSFRDLDSFATRNLSFSPRAAKRNHPVKLNLTLNDDDSGHHRILIKYRLEQSQNGQATNGLPPGWTPYDPKAASDLLQDARSALVDCLYKKDENTGQIKQDGQGNKVFGLDEQGGQNKKQFKYDLLRLALIGEKLYNVIYQQVNPEASSKDRDDWRYDFANSLAQASLIQVARTGQAQYVFPWALVYEYPIPGVTIDEQGFCKVLQEWGDDGRRQGPLRSSCPYQDKDWHREGILCPYGFWGLKHIIEQPPAALRKSNKGDGYEFQEITNKIYTGEQLDLAIAVTRDTNLTLSRLDTHLQELAHIPGVQVIPPDPADDWNKVRAMLRGPELVYFLCHGEYDADLREPYLGVGLRNSDPRYRVYPNKLVSWQRTQAYDREAWKRNRPLVMINGCHTANLTPGEILNFVSTFTDIKASGVIGTEVSVELSLATDIAKSLVTKIAKKKHVGEAIREMRWELANKGNLLGLAYTMYCLADLHIVGDGE